jgi:hypothetical protein
MRALQVRRHVLPQLPEWPPDIAWPVEPKPPREVEDVEDVEERDEDDEDDDDDELVLLPL